MEDLRIEGEPEEVFEIRKKIVDTFADLQFFEEGHRYTLHGKEIPSVTTVIHNFQEHPDFDKIAEAKAEREGLDKDGLLDSWMRKNRISTILGTRVHEYGESLSWLKNGHPELICDSIKQQYVHEKNWLLPIHPKEEAIEKFINDLPSSYHLVLNEAKVYNKKETFCGTFDMLYFYKHPKDDSRSGFVILDYKNNASLENDFSRNKGKMLFPPFNNMFDEPKSLYALQLSAYSIPLKELFDYPILDRKLIWVKNDGEYEKITLQDYSDILVNVI